MDWHEINDMWVKPARSAWLVGDTAGAERIFRDGLEATDNDGFVALMFAKMLEELGRLPEAKQYYELALTGLPLKKYKDQASQGLHRVASGVGGARGTRESAPFGGVREVPRRRWGLITCTKPKKPYVCTARELYSESSNFVNHLEFAEAHYDHAYVVSARHGLVGLDQVLAPYDRSLTEFTDDERASWARFIVANLRLEGLSETDEVFIHADALYAESLEHALRGCVSEIHAVAFEEGPSLEIDGFSEDVPF